MSDMAGTLLRPRILVVDDEAAVQDIVAELLTESGYAVDAVGCSADALAAVARYPYDLVISDVRLPGCSGTSLAREISCRYPGLAGRIILLTGEPGEAEAALPVIHKPFQLEDVLDAVTARLAIV